MPSDEKRYRECMAEMIGVLKKYDMAGALTVVSQERAMFKYHFPAWTAIELGEDHIRLRLKTSDFANKEAAHRCAELTAHAIMQIGDCAKNTINLVDHLAGMMRDKWGMEHTPNAEFDPELSQ